MSVRKSPPFNILTRYPYVIPFFKQTSESEYLTHTPVELIGFKNHFCTISEDPFCLSQKFHAVGNRRNDSGNIFKISLRVFCADTQQKTVEVLVHESTPHIFHKRIYLGRR